MKKLTPLHSRFNVIPRPDIANALHGMDVEGGYIDNAIWGRVHVSSPIQYATPAPRDSFAFGEIAAVGTPDELWKGPAPAKVGDIIGFDLWQIGHEFGAEAFYANARTFYTLPWGKALCRFVEGKPLPLTDWVMVEPDEVRTFRWLAGARLISAPGMMGGSVGTNTNSQTKVRGVVGEVLDEGGKVPPFAPRGWYAIYNPLDAVTIDLPGQGKRSFVRWGDIEQAVEDDD